MEWIDISIASGLLSGSVLFLWRRHRIAAKTKSTAYLKRIEDVVESMQETKRTCLTSLENMHRSLAELQTRAASSEGDLNGFIEAPNPGRKEHYEAAALLLATGQSVERVARMLNLPVNQVEFVQELRKLVAGENHATATQTGDRAERTSHNDAKKRRAPARPKSKVQPILLTDPVNFPNPAGVNGVDNSGTLNGTAAY